MPNDLTLDDLKNALGNQCDHDRGRLVLQDIISQVLAGFKGKKITKRVATKAKAALPDGAIVHYSREYGRTELVVWGCSGIEYKDRVGFMICYDPTTAAYDPDTFDDLNPRYGEAARERISLRQALLDSPCRELTQVCTAVRDRNAAQAALDLALSSLESDRFCVEAMIQWKG